MASHREVQISPPAKAAPDSGKLWESWRDLSLGPWREWERSVLIGERCRSAHMAICAPRCAPEEHFLLSRSKTEGIGCSATHVLPSVTRGSKQSVCVPTCATDVSPVHPVFWSTPPPWCFKSRPEHYAFPEKAEMFQSQKNNPEFQVV